MSLQDYSIPPAAHLEAFLQVTQ